MIADVSTPQERPKNFALIGISFGLGFIIGPALGALLSPLSLDAPAYAAGILSLASMLAMWFGLPETLPPGKRNKAPLTARDFNPLVSIGAMLRKPGMPALFAVSLAFAFGFNATFSIFGKYVAEKFVVPPWQIGLYFFVAGVMTLYAQTRMVQPMTRRYGEKNMASMSLIGQIVGAVATVVAPAFWMLIVLSPVLSFFRGFMWSSLGTMTANKVEPREQGVLAGVTTALQSAMSVIGPITAGAVYDNVNPGASVLMSAVVFLIGLVFMLNIKYTRPPQTGQAWGH